ncbi:MAG TPA: twin-arginine translocase TatA/TatE family subunit [Acidobacteriota bacterium]|nr:twin-arginine translocase TatA/TatE family subunit [Acidobacteriota bacterium]
MGNLGFPEILIIVVIALLFFGPSKLPEIGKSLGKGISEFKKAFARGEAGSDEKQDRPSETTNDKPGQE